ncbi:unnamed protein product [Lactuca virosa]|uniref:DUF4283 domain-containing protein n=1 Tax=Lactuca virosa TaxID=75947 RepID=A0AAU9N1R7_9ASTR|nr:unnamed protein product [Lactuca virosa]
MWTPRSFGQDSSRKHVVAPKGSSQPKTGGSPDHSKGSFANVMRGGIVQNNNLNGSLVLEGKEISNDLALKPSVFCQVKNVKLIPKLLVLLKEEGFHEIQLRYLGGDWVYVVFDSELVCSKSKKVAALRAYFSNFRPVVNGFKVLERVIWIEILGLPCCAWNNVDVSKLAGRWGDVCFLEDDIQAPLAVKRICIKTLKPSLIHDKISVVVLGISYELVVRELANWEPDIVCNDDILDREMPNLSGDSDNEELECDVNDGEYTLVGNNQDNVDEFLHDFSNDKERGAGFVDRRGRFFSNKL